MPREEQKSEAANFLQSLDKVHISPAVTRHLLALSPYCWLPHFMMLAAFQEVATSGNAFNAFKLPAYTWAAINNDNLKWLGVQYDDEGMSVPEEHLALAGFTPWKVGFRRGGTQGYFVSGQILSISTGLMESVELKIRFRQNKNLRRFIIFCNRFGLLCRLDHLFLNFFLGGRDFLFCKNFWENFTQIVRHIIIVGFDELLFHFFRIVVSSIDECVHAYREAWIYDGAA
jgi:hypothetical protein